MWLIFNLTHFRKTYFPQELPNVLEKFQEEIEEIITLVQSSKRGLLYCIKEYFLFSS